MLTVTLWTSLAAPPSFEGMRRRLLGQGLGDVVLVVQVLELLVLVRPLPEVLDVAGDLGAEVLELADDRRDHLEDQEDEEPEQDHVDDQDRQPAREYLVATHPQALDPVHRRAHGERQEQRCEDPPDLGAHVEDDDREQQRSRDHRERDRCDLDYGSGLDPGGIHGRLSDREGSARALKSLHSMAARLPQPGASPSPPPAGGVALGGATAATDKVI